MSASVDDRPTNSYWVDPGRFAAGEYPGARRRRWQVRTLRAGVTFIDLTLGTLCRDWGADAARHGVRAERHAIVDMGVPRSQQQTAGILDAIDKALDGKNVRDCWGGIGRTGTVVGCWLVRHGMTGDLAQIARGGREWRRGTATPARHKHHSRPELDRPSGAAA